MKDKLAGRIDTVVSDHLVLNRDHMDFISAAGLTHFNRLWHYQDGLMIKSIAERSVLRFSLSIQGNTRVFYLKRHVPEYRLLGRLLGSLLPNIFGSEGRREFSNLCDFRRAGLRTVTPIALGERYCNLFQVESFLLTEDCTPYVSLEEIILHQPETLRGEVHAEKRKRLLRAIAAYAVAMHACGYNHRDFNANHILVHGLDDENPAIALFDLQRMDRNPLTRFRWLIKAFAELNYTLPPTLFSEDERLFLLRAYKDKQNLNLLDRMQWLLIQRKTHRIAKHTQKMQKLKSQTGIAEGEKMISVHVVGCPRSGTTLLTEMMATCFQVTGSCEHEESIFDLSPLHRGIYLSKKPNDILWISRIIDRDKNLYVIGIIRDPRSVICSIHQGHPGIYFCNYRVWKRAEQALSTLQNHPRILLLRYEELVSNPNGVQARIRERFPFLQLKHAFSDFHLHASPSKKSAAALGGVMQVDRERTQGWKKHLPRLKQQILRYPGLVEDLIIYDYEKDRDWLRILEGVTPKKFPCRYSDRSEFFKYLEQHIRFFGKIRGYLAARNL